MTGHLIPRESILNVQEAWDRELVLPIASAGRAAELALIAMLDDPQFAEVMAKRWSTSHYEFVGPGGVLTHKFVVTLPPPMEDKEPKDDWKQW